MLSRSISGASLALILLTGAATAAERGGLLGGFSLPGIFGSKSQSAQQPARPAAPTQLAQAGDPRISQLEEQMRQLSGTIEELNFQILQMQEQMRKQQEDIEFRLQEIEGGGQPAKSNKQGEASPPPAGKSDRRVASAGEAVIAPPTPTSDSATAPVPGGSITTLGTPSAGSDAAGTGQSAQPLGTITFDASGNVTGGSVGDQTVVSRGADIPSDGTKVAALPSTNDPEELYSNAYEFILSGDYETAEAGFRDHIARFPKDARAADAQFWLGEALLGQEKYRDAAEVFLTANKSYPKSRKAPDMLFKLGVSLAGLNQHDVACATFGEVEKRYPTMSEALRKRVKQEKAATSC
jgi:tol-pal system protein YbgF